MHFHYEQPLPRVRRDGRHLFRKAGKAEPYLLCNNAATLVWLAHIGCLEIHPWHSRARRGADAKGAGTDYATSLAALEASVLNRPDFVVCDLDPYLYAGTEAPGHQPEFNAEGVDALLEVALIAEGALDTMGLRRW